MHELSICSAIAGTARDHAGGRQIKAVRLQIGHFRQIVPETLSYCWGIHTKETDMDGCELIVDYVPAVAKCNACGTETNLDIPVLRCEACSSIDVTLLTGEEFMVQAIDIEENT
jgi:hydrogenase nickel incorporation protein HypA/HybF